MPKLRKSQIFNIVVFLIGTGVIIQLIRSIGYDTTREHLQRTGWDFLWLFPIYLVTMLGDTVSWRLLIRKPVSMIRLMLAANSGTAINALTPSGDGGEFVKGNLIGSEIGAHEAVSSLLLWNFLYAVTKKIITIAGPLLVLRFGPFAAAPKPLSTISRCVVSGAGILAASYLRCVLAVMRIGVVRIARKVHRIRFLRKLDLSRVDHFSRQLMKHSVISAFGTEPGSGAAILLLIVHISVCFEICSCCVFWRADFLGHQCFSLHGLFAAANGGVVFPRGNGRHGGRQHGPVSMDWVRPRLRVHAGVHPPPAAAGIQRHRLGVPRISGCKALRAASFQGNCGGKSCWFHGNVLNIKKKSLTKRSATRCSVSMGAMKVGKGMEHAKMRVQKLARPFRGKRNDGASPRCPQWRRRRSHP
jgi:hypothetical protein